MWRRPVLRALPALFAIGAACTTTAHSRDYAPPGEQLILPEDIARSGATDAWEVVRRLSHMSTTTTIAGTPSRMYRRGHGSLLIRETPVVIVDGINASDIQILTTIRADQIAWMRVLTGAASTTRYGARGGAGAVIVKTVGAEESIAAAPVR